MTPEGTAAQPGRHGDGSELAISAALAELEGYQLLAKRDFGGAFVKFAKATGMRPEARARAHLRVKNLAFAESTARLAVERAPGEVTALATLVEVIHAAGDERGAKEAYRKLRPLARDADRDLPPFQRLRPIVSAWEKTGSWSAEDNEPASGDTSVERIDISKLGPLTWSPFRAGQFAINDTAGRTWSLAGARGKNTLVLFYLGGKCAHCMQQLQVFGKEVQAMKAVNTDIVAISTDDIAATQALKANSDGIKFPMPLLADPGLEVFKAYRCYDDFERQPLHGTFLIDSVGGVRYQRISADPFLDVAFIKSEAARINALVVNQRPIRNPSSDALSGVSQSTSAAKAR